MSRRIRVAAASAALLATVGGGVAAAGSANSASAPPPAAYNLHDVTFVQSMLPHHQMAIDMAEVARKRAQTPAVRSLAEKIVSAQTAEVRQLRGLLSQYRARPAETPQPIAAMDKQDMMMLEQARGMHVDHMFLMMMRPHHSQAVSEGRDQLIHGRAPAVRRIARNIYEGQLREISYMNGLLAKMPMRHGDGHEHP